MKNFMRLIILLIIILLVGTLSCSKEDDQYKMFDGFNIFLLKDENMTADIASKQELSNLELQIQPLVSSNDIKYYDYSTHILYLNHELKIYNSVDDISVFGKPFVVIANGERQYLGAFWSGLSSSMFFGPVINVAPRFYPDDIIHISCLQYSLQQSQDLRENYEIREALISTGKYHAGLECAIVKKKERALPDGRIWIGELYVIKSLDIQFKKSNENLIE